MKTVGVDDRVAFTLLHEQMHSDFREIYSNMWRCGQPVPEEEFRLRMYDLFFRDEARVRYLEYLARYLELEARKGERGGRQREMDAASLPGWKRFQEARKDPDPASAQETFIREEAKALSENADYKKYREAWRSE